MPRPMLYGSRISNDASYACGLWSNPAEWIILWMDRKSKLANNLSIHSNNVFSFHILPIIHAYNIGISWLRSYTRFELHARLRLEDMTSVIYPDSGRPSRLRSTSQLRTYLLTPVAHHSFSQWARRLSYHLSCEKLHMAGLDDCSIL
jgi:hypothetical protein